MPPRSRSSAPATYRAGVGPRTRRPLRQGAAPPLPPTNLLVGQAGARPRRHLRSVTPGRPGPSRRSPGRRQRQTR